MRACAGRRSGRSVRVRYVGKVYRPLSEADALIVQATIGCSGTTAPTADMYRDKPRFSVRPLEETLEDLAGGKPPGSATRSRGVRRRRRRPGDGPGALAADPGSVPDPVPAAAPGQLLRHRR